MAKENIKMDTNNSPQDINRNIKTLRNWNWTDTKNAKTVRSITIGQYVEIGEVKGFIARYEDDSVFIEDSAQQGKLVEIGINKFLKAFKANNTKKEIVANVAVSGPNNGSVASAPKVGNETTIKVDSKATKAKDQKIVNNVNKISSIKTFTDLSDEFDSTKISTTSKNAISTEVTATADKKNDDIMKISKVKKFTQLTTDLEATQEQGKLVKSKAKNIEANIDGKSTKTEDSTIVVNKVKTFTQLKSDFESKPKQGSKIGSKKSISTELDGTADKNDVKIYNQNNTLKTINDFLNNK